MLASSSSPVDLPLYSPTPYPPHCWATHNVSHLHRPPSRAWFHRPPWHHPPPHASCLLVLACSPVPSGSLTPYRLPTSRAHVIVIRLISMSCFSLSQQLLSVISTSHKSCWTSGQDVLFANFNIYLHMKTSCISWDGQNCNCKIVVCVRWSKLQLQNSCICEMIEIGIKK